jgi:hypothetical protein
MGWTRKHFAPLLRRLLAVSSVEIAADMHSKKNLSGCQKNAASLINYKEAATVMQ